jgi:hypothetical protein
MSSFKVRALVKTERLQSIFLLLTELLTGVSGIVSDSSLPTVYTLIFGVVSMLDGI